MSQDQKDAAGQALINGALAGFVATIPMTIFMLTTQRFLPHGQRYELPPEIITKDLARRADVEQHMDKGQILGATTLSHFGYGAAMGALYGLLTKRASSPLVGTLRGVLFGLGVWVASYLGLLPLLRMAASGHREPGQRNLMMIVAHIVWGATLGLATDGLLQREESHIQG
ncbi:DUF1440 domain-containing protein [Ktedonosporobacter rubrisoli]|nr:DUF1440 domain-containing protein [Ktedonosporobacter rubrisoli]